MGTQEYLYARLLSHQQRDGGGGPRARRPTTAGGGWIDQLAERDAGQPQPAGEGGGDIGTDARGDHLRFMQLRVARDNLRAALQDRRELRVRGEAGGLTPCVGVRIGGVAAEQAREARETFIAALAAAVGRGVVIVIVRELAEDAPHVGHRGEMLPAKRLPR